MIAHSCFTDLCGTDNPGISAVQLSRTLGICYEFQSYLDEVCFRFNRHMTGDQVFLRLTRAVATSCGVLS